MEHVILLVTNLRKATLSENTAKGLHTVGSTFTLGAYVFDLEEECMFTATHCLIVSYQLSKWSHHNSATDKNKRISLRPLSTTIIIITPNVLEDSTENNTLILLRFYHFAIDAKPTIFQIRT